MDSDIDIRYAIMAVSLLVVCLSYALIARLSHSWLNWATLWFVIAVGGDYLLQWPTSSAANDAGSLYAFGYCYTIYALKFLTTAGSYALTTRCRTVRCVRSSLPPSPQWQPWILLLAGFLLYLPVLIAFREYLTEPRQIYVMTRTGYGLTYFGSSALIFLAAICKMFTRATLLSNAIFFAACSMLLYLHGSKGQILLLLFLWLLHRVYIFGKRASMIHALGGALCLSIVFAASFALFANIDDILELEENVAGYADSTRNAMKVIDDNDAPRYYGELTLTANLYGRIPRAIWHDKPKNFGSFALAERYYPDWFRQDSGSPAFGIGVQYADFGDWAAFIILLESAVTGIAVGFFRTRLSRTPDPATFVLFLSAAGIDLIPAGDASMFPEAVLMSIALRFLLSRYRFTSAIRGQSPSSMALRTTECTTLPVCADAL